MHEVLDNLLLAQNFQMYSKYETHAQKFLYIGNTYQAE